MLIAGERCELASSWREMLVLPSKAEEPALCTPRFRMAAMAASLIAAWLARLR